MKTKKQILVHSVNKDLLKQTLLKALILLATGCKTAPKNGFWRPASMCKLCQAEKAIHNCLTAQVI